MTSGADMKPGDRRGQRTIGKTDAVEQVDERGESLRAAPSVRSRRSSARSLRASPPSASASGVVATHVTGGRAHEIAQRLGERLLLRGELAEFTLHLRQRLLQCFGNRLRAEELEFGDCRRTRENRRARACSRTCLRRHVPLARGAARGERADWKALARPSVGS
jgi:hypothetical protein